MKMVSRTEDRQLTTSQQSAMSDLTDEQLLLEYQKSGEQEFLSLLVHRYERELYNYLRRYLGDAMLAEDAFQATFLQVHQKSHLFDGSRKVRPWLYTVATNQAIDIQRRNKRHQLVSLDRPHRAQHAEVGSLIDLLETGETSPGERFDLREKVEWVREAVAKLPEKFADTIRLVYFQGMKQREAAEKLAVPVGTVKSRIHSAVQQLGDQWEEAHGNRRPK